MPLFSKYKQVNGYVEAVLCTDTNLAEVIKELIAHLHPENLSSFKIDNARTANQTISWQYLTDEELTTLSIGQYLVRSTTGKYSVMNKDDFESKYFKSTQVILTKNTNIQGAIGRLVNIPEVEVTVDKITSILQDQLKHWYDKDTDTVTVNLVDKNITSLKGLATLVKGILNTNYFSSTTYLVIDLSSNDRDLSNMLDPIAFNELQGELKAVGLKVGRRLRKIILTNSVADTVTVKMKAGVQAIATKTSNAKIAY